MITKRTFGRLAIAAAAATLFTSAMAADVTVAYITNGNTNEGWTLINGGAKKAGQAKGVKFIELAADKGELSRQLAIVEDMITRKVNAIAIAPVDSAGIAPAINKALAAGITVVAVDTGITGAKITSYVATDNIKAANVQGKWAAGEIKDGDTVIYVTGDQGQSTGQERKKGFVDALNAGRKNVKIVEVATTWDQTMAQNGVEAALRANPNAKVIACAWDGGALGAKAALMAGAMPAESTGAMAIALTLRVIMSSTMASWRDNSPLSAANSMNLTPLVCPAFLAPPLIRVQPSLVLPLVM